MPPRLAPYLQLTTSAAQYSVFSLTKSKDLSGRQIRNTTHFLTHALTLICHQGQQCHHYHSCQLMYRPNSPAGPIVLMSSQYVGAFPISQQSCIPNSNISMPTPTLYFPSSIRHICTSSIIHLQPIFYLCIDLGESTPALQGNRKSLHQDAYVLVLVRHLCVLTWLPAERDICHTRD